ncbi:unnamed protein product, partial [Effrenium voratum]
AAVVWHERLHKAAGQLKKEKEKREKELRDHEAKMKADGDLRRLEREKLAEKGRKKQESEEELNELEKEALALLGKGKGFGPEDLSEESKKKLQRIEDRQADLEREALLEAASGTQQEVRVGYSWSIAQNRGEGPRKMPLEDYLRHEMQTGLYDGETFLEPKYAFDMGLKLPGMPGREAIPKAIRDWNASSFSADQAVTLQMLGAARSAVGWHSHGASVQMTIFGRLLG